MSEPALRTVHDYTEAELRAWAEVLVTVGSPQAAAVLRLLDEREHYQRTFNVAREAISRLQSFILSLADRVHKQSELLGRRAERTEGE